MSKYEIRKTIKFLGRLVTEGEIPIQVSATASEYVTMLERWLKKNRVSEIKVKRRRKRRRAKGGLFTAHPKPPETTVGGSS